VQRERPTVAELRKALRQGKHPALEQNLPLITELPTESQKSKRHRQLRYGMLALIGGNEHMLPPAWLKNDTVLMMLHDRNRRSALYLLVMHSRCNLQIHVDMHGTGLPTRHMHATRPHLATHLYQPLSWQLSCIMRTMD